MLLNAIQAKVEGQPLGCMYMETIINGKPRKPCWIREPIRSIWPRNLPTKWALLTLEFVKGVNVRSLLIEGIARGALI